MEYIVNGVNLKYEAQGERRWGEEIILLDQATDITAANPWHPIGYTIEDLFDDSTYKSFFERTQALLIECWEKAGLSIEADFKLDQYHTLAKDTGTHLAAVEKTKLLPIERFPVSIGLLEERVSEICKVPLVAKNPFDDLSIFHFRVIRPEQSDYNPLHRDVWLEDYDDCINLYIPVAGSNVQSSLTIIPGSHRWPESRIEKTTTGALIEGVQFSVPAVTAIRDWYTVERPSPLSNQILVFSPYLIHGGAANLNRTATRISIEMRLWKK